VKSIVSFALLVVASFGGFVVWAAAADTPAAREVLNFNPGWRLFVGDPAGAHEPGFDDSAWKPVTLPRAWNEDDAFEKDIVDLRTGIAWYRKTFTLPAGAQEKKVFLEFEGVRQAAEIWINGRAVGGHENGVTAFGFDVSEFVKPAPEMNVVAVRTNNAWDYRERLSGARYQWSDKNFNANYGGIPKNVRLHLAGRVYQTLPLYTHLGSTGVYVYAADFDIAGRAATIHAESEIRNEATASQTFTYRVSVNDRDGRTVARFDGGSYKLAPRERVLARASSRISDLNFWSWGYGYLYDVTTSLEVDGKVIDALTTRTGFRKTEFARGMVTLNDRLIQLKGYAQRTSNEWPALGLSVPAWLSDYSNGLMVESGANLVRWMHIAPWKQDVESCDRVGLMQMLPAGDSERDAQGRQWVQRTEVMRDAIIYNRNNPSVLVYESGNNGISEEHMAEMKALRDTFDPHGGRAIGSRDMLDSKVAEYGGEMLYVNKSARQPYWQTEYSRDEGLRKYWDEFSPPYHKDGDGPLYRDAPARQYNRNQDSHAVENVVRWYDFWRERPGTGTRVNSGGVNIVFSDTNTHHRGAENYRRSGEVDAMRIPKDGFYAHQVMWDGWVDVENPRAHILGHWNYAAGVTKPVYVVSSAESVELFLNGQSLGRGTQSSRFLFTFPAIAWQPGTLTAVGYDTDGKKICEASHDTAGEPAAIKLTLLTGEGGQRADAADVALVQVEVVDKDGRRCPTALNLVEFDLNGPAEWRGGIAQGPRNYVLAKALPVECGVNRVLVRSTLESGRVVLAARSAGLAATQIEWTTKPFAAEGGWTRWLTSDLPGRLERGPTPGTPSFKPTRIAITVTRATATDGGDPAHAIDDNEVTAWSGRQPITFELSRAARLSEITMKTSGFRARSYPIRVTVDGTEVYRGATPRSLGYVTLALKPVTGQIVRIEALAGSEARDAFGGITELVDQKNATTGEEKVGANALGLIEVEFYESLSARAP
jgi:beta-galactosidase